MACPRCTFINVDQRHRCKMCGSTFPAEIDGCRSSEGAAGEGKDWAEEERAIEASDRTIAWILGGGGREETVNFYGDSREGNIHRLVASLGFPVAEKPSFRLAYSAPALRFWVEQIGRSCGAVSVANALNALCGSPVADQQSVMRIFECQLERRIVSLKRGLAREKLEARRQCVSRRLSAVKTGLKKLRCGSTAFFGNTDVKLGAISAAQAMCPAGLKLKVRTLLNRVEKTDEHDCSASWDTLWDAVCDPNQQIIFHCTNHYALVFAVREWKDVNTGLLQRQVLTSKAMQAPSVWMHFDEVAKILDKWKGYKMMALNIKN